MDVSMSRQDREKFLAETRVGVLAVTDSRGGHGPLQAPIWYAYEPGREVVVFTGDRSLKARCIREAGRFGLCVQDESLPVRYVSVEGPVTSGGERIDPVEWEALTRRYLDLYVDQRTASSYVDASRRQLIDNVAFRMRPQHWRSADFTAISEQFS